MGGDYLGYASIYVSLSSGLETFIAEISNLGRHYGMYIMNQCLFSLTATIFKVICHPDTFENLDRGE